VHERDHRRSRGAGLLSTASGLGLFLLLLLVAVQLCVTLYARSLTTSAAYDAARTVAGHRSIASRCDARVTAEAEFRRQLGRFGAERAQLFWESLDDPDVIRVRVVAPTPSLLPAAARAALGLGATDRTLEVRVERFR
jgi:hypothetical protein